MSYEIKENSGSLLMNKKETNTERCVVFKSNINEAYYFTIEENWHKYKPDGTFIAVVESHQEAQNLCSKLLNKK